MEELRRTTVLNKIPFYLKGRHVSALLLGHHQVKHRKYLKGPKHVVLLNKRKSYSIQLCSDPPTFTVIVNQHNGDVTPKD
jgi:hypothetical protein